MEPSPHKPSGVQLANSFLKEPSMNEEEAQAYRKLQAYRVANPLIASSPNYDKYMAAKRLRELFECLSGVCFLMTFIEAYRSELHHLNNAPAVYLGPGR